MTETPRVEERENGPLIVKNVTTMVGSDGNAVETKEVMALCRCGHSGNKPFCDGTHKKVGFQSRGGAPAGKDRLIAYEGAEATVTYNPMICSHAAECGRLASHMFNPAMKPWIQPDKGTLEELRTVVAACPSGALALGDTEEREHLFAGRAQITVEKNGPYWMENVAAPVPTQGDGMSERKFVLCRCGLSGNKPFCDGSHREAGWKDG